MSFTAFTNIITILFCVAVIVQSVRMMRSLNQVRESQLDRTVGALDTATAKTRSVLFELKEILTTEGAANARSLAEAREVREELNVMVGIANAMAERLIEAASTGSRGDTTPAAAASQAPKPTQTARSRSATSGRSAAKPAKASTPKATKSSGTGPKTVKEPAARKPAAKKTGGRKTANKPELVLDVKEMA
ncbi:DUF6468 domain-containing protein [Alteriqipengyuania lutimaris]|uniref:DUF6468 domain-containing protein n=1 Tax=Alteriqipengyuania lutimaris TaxID=1538146 RepID=A0A395LPN0_9SPHN|nr:DUF6468 domain-containing protein [Alteriqipengyuania lutimaris]MBB3032463.1 hypothetical protein [Alteriqipengyuania lutimaris]RDS78397.1 hypothetical protein DL238_12820 [Alteriqipengyuania lutimaris]